MWVFGLYPVPFSKPSCGIEVAHRSQKWSGYHRGHEELCGHMQEGRVKVLVGDSTYPHEWPEPAPSLSLCASRVWTPHSHSRGFSRLNPLLALKRFLPFSNLMSKEAEACVVYSLETPYSRGHISTAVGVNALTLKGHKIV